MDKIFQKQAKKIEQAMADVSAILNQNLESNVEKLSKRVEQKFFEIPFENDKCKKMTEFNNSIAELRKNTVETFEELADYIKTSDIILEDWAG